MEILYFGSMWPRKNMSAAGVRTYKILELLKNLEKNTSITYVSPQKVSSEFASQLQPCKTVSLQINDPISFKNKLNSLKPKFCFFDTFISEEFYGWMVNENFPECIRVLDTQDLRTLRKFRHKTILNNPNITLKELSTLKPSTDSVENDLMFREFSSMLRCDLNFIVSSFEYNMLVNDFQFPKNKLEIASFFYETPNKLQHSFHEKFDFFSIGNFNHEPNVDAIEYLKHKIWPRIHKELPNANCFIYGALPKEKDFKLQDKEKNFHIVGELKNLSYIQKFRVQIAPLRYQTSSQT
jgi:O-antigen biosynthesis protein